MKLALIVLATLVAGVGSVWVAATLIRVGFGRADSRIQTHHLLSFAAGALLATAFVHLLPEAMEGTVDSHVLFPVLLGGLVVFFLLDKAELWHHGHEHGLPESVGRHGHAGDGHAHHDIAHGHHHHHHGSQRSGAWAVLTGDSVHCFGDGILIASAFLVDWRIGILAALSVLAHEVPHHIGDLIVLMVASKGSAADRRRIALVKVSIAGAVTMLGGLSGYLLLGFLDRAWLPYFLVVAASSFIYVALADLIPQLQLQLSARQTAMQVVWLLAGMALVTGVSTLLHQGHAHGHAHGHVHGEDATALESFRQHPLHIERLRPAPAPVDAQ
ncbi:ZIP family metal transporter [Lampropedia cohaerens]|uniref:ZIP family metal transporter n=1 Tax=Lampropedia cohaerens TaxID=1610491 RepID=UPI000A07DA4F|nr:ZIP family metal transporter [Lampropedia cohaerens]